MANTQEQSNGNITSPEKMENIKTKFYNTCEVLRNKELKDSFFSNHTQVVDFYHRRGRMLGIDTSFINPEMSSLEIFANWIDAYWQKVEPLLLNRPALCDFIIEKRLVDSEMFWSFLLGPMDYLGAEAAYRWGFDPVGVYRCAASSDPFTAWAKSDEFFAFQRWRNEKLLKEIIEADEVLVLDCGSLPELRMSDYIYDNQYRFREQTFHACDIDLKVDLDFLMMEYVPEAKRRIHYQQYSISEMLVEMVNSNETFDLIYLKDSLSFRLKSIQPLMQAALRLLNPGGKFVFDLRLLHPTLEEYKKIFGLDGLELPTTMEVVDLVEKARRKIGLRKNQLVPPIVMKDSEGDDFGIIISVMKA